MIDDATEFRVEFALPYGSLMQAMALAGLRRFEDSYDCLNAAFAQAVRCTDTFGQQAVYAGRVRAFLHEGRVGGGVRSRTSRSFERAPRHAWRGVGFPRACVGLHRPSCGGSTTR